MVALFGLDAARPAPAWGWGAAVSPPGLRACWLRVFAALVLALSATACASLPQDVPRKPSTALSDPGATPLGRLTAQSAPDPALSGFHLVASGEEAFGTLMTLADRATRTLDLQYYIVEADESSREILLRVRAAAERGVRVRMLVDDLHSDGKDIGFLRFAKHPNIEVRLFNPFPAGRFSKVTRMLSSAADVRRVNRRMHNKVFIADNALAMTGGRNIGNAYFLRAPDTNFVDLDVIVAGPAVRELSAAFDEYWKSPFAFPVESLANPNNAPANPGVGAAAASSPAAQANANGEQAVLDEDAERKRLEERGMTPPKRIDPGASFLARQIRSNRLSLEWAKASVLVDDPAKVSPQKTPDSGDTLADELARMIANAKQEVIIISPYFVPGKEGLKLLSDLAARGVKIRVLTNSLAATDAPIVHVGYKRYRTDLLKAGVELHELKSRLNRPQKAVGDFKSSQASLHVKAAVVDRSNLFVGSMNFDPRSVTQNTETGIIVRNARLAGQVEQLFSGSVGENSYLLRLSDQGKLQWVDGEGDKAVVHDIEPDTTWSQRFWLNVLSPFTPEELL
ncbi:phospholipase D family protein [Cupriavidus respiraculi]|uniref:phospholipase D family protein n=1 Tax=Cupriavidus respiraculi TaxID=195930 RepID=UPI001C96BA6D|nr:phospholipase D family protein [Cupriavidus respiraculi]MBY4947585.1 phospholipase D family protein [Cupriavidus respiraculi]